MNVFYLFDTPIILAIMLFTISFLAMRFFNKKSTSTRYLITTTSLLIITVIFRILSALFTAYDIYSRELDLYLVNVFVSISICSSTFFGAFWLLFETTYFGKNRIISKRISTISLTYSTIISILVATSPFTHLFFKVTEDTVEYTKLFIMILPIQLLFYLPCIIKVIIKRKSLTTLEYIIFLSLNTLLLISVILAAFQLVFIISNTVLLSSFILMYIMLKENLSIYDTSTNLLKRKYFDSFMEEQKRNGYKNYSIVYLKLDGFNYLNKNFGENEQKLALKLFSRCLRNSVSTRERVVYLERNDFLIYFNTKNEKSILEVFKNLNDNLNDINKQGLIKMNLKYIYATAFYDDNTKSYSNLIRKAYNELYEKKHSLNFVKEEINE